jgi:hypothetical protein
MPLPFRPSAARRLLPLAALAAALAAPAVRAQRAPEPLWEAGLGAVAISQQARPGAAEQAQRGLVLPWLIWRGPVLRADRDGAGLRAWRTEQWELDVGLAGTVASRSSQGGIRAGLPALGTLVEAGPRLRIFLGPEQDGVRWRVDLPLRGVFDLDDRLAHRGLTFQPALVRQQRIGGGWSWNATAGVLLADRRLAALWYEVPAAQATPQRPAWEAQAGLVAWRTGVTFFRELGPDWRLFGFVRLDSTAGAANRGSPLLQQELGWSAGAGVAWTALRSQRPAAD